MQFRGTYFFLSNFYPSPIHYNGLVYPTAENAFQAAKCRNEKDKMQFTRISPADAKRLGRKVQLREDWENVKVTIMCHLINIKFSDPELKKQLLATADKNCKRKLQSALLMEMNFALFYFCCDSENLIHQNSDYILILRKGGNICRKAVQTVML